MKENITRSGNIQYPVAERFLSINGEGPRAGCLAAFIRMKGCNLNCSYCDTSWANREDCPCTFYSLKGLLSWLGTAGAACVTLTGGEPLLTPGIADLIEGIGAAGFQLEIESNGSIDITPFHVLPHRPAFTLDYKCPDSGMEEFMNTDNYALLQQEDTVKFVAGSIRDLDRAFEIDRTYDLGSRCHVFLSAVFGKISPEQIVEYMISHQWKTARLQLQMHKFIWPPDRKGV
ncbi:MAG: putative 7-carboxy-7-deazaguanine synthase QueE [Eubacterium sp.]|nr:putative 7-carboxy-7-deazaguanine synthase QueE [Eubacterium sp.]